ncbi:MAG: sulfur carrier protein ThiS [Planctomycetota bacterium]|nr:sulfur carrier protein ThiS [Planctomycetota bacterium]
MKVTINGETRTMPESCSIKVMLDEMELGQAACAVEVNEELITKGRHAQCILSEGDAIEIVTLVGGG